MGVSNKMRWLTLTKQYKHVKRRHERKLEQKTSIGGKGVRFGNDITQMNH
jgi:hypothetical protein